MGVAPAAVMTFYATRSGGLTLDRDDAGGNPFASALIEIADDPSVRLRDLSERLRRSTLERSAGLQVTESAGHPPVPDWTLHGAAASRSERRHALVLVVSDYSRSDLTGLDGAAFDERRITSSLSRNGFVVTRPTGPDRESLLAGLTSFRRVSARSDVALIYSTGHGVEFDGAVYLLPGDFVLEGRSWAAQLRTRAVPVSRMASAARAREVNLVFFAGCRELPEAAAKG
jgi:hypothetical protein